MLSNTIKAQIKTIPQKLDKHLLARERAERHLKNLIETRQAIEEANLDRLSKAQAALEDVADLIAGGADSDVISEHREKVSIIRREIDSEQDLIEQLVKYSIPLAEGEIKSTKKLTAEALGHELDRIKVLVEDDFRSQVDRALETFEQWDIECEKIIDKVKSKSPYIGVMAASERLVAKCMSEKMVQHFCSLFGLHMDSHWWDRQVKIFEEKLASAKGREEDPEASQAA